jgi:SAM-dependent methyltransferase
LPDEAFDAVISQFGLMFFEDKNAALKEMWRVLRPGGRLAVAVWDRLDHVPGYASMTALLQRLFGERVADELRTPYAMGEPDKLSALFAEAGIPNVKIRTRDHMARFPSIESWVQMDVKGWTLGDLIDDAQYQTLLQEARKEMKPYLERDGTVAFPSPAHIVTAAKA